MICVPEKHKLRIKCACQKTSHSFLQTLHLAAASFTTQFRLRGLPETQAGQR
jgi:hypothetical protein